MNSVEYIAGVTVSGAYMIQMVFDRCEISEYFIVVDNAAWIVERRRSTVSHHCIPIVGQIVFRQFAIDVVD